MNPAMPADVHDKMELTIKGQAFYVHPTLLSAAFPQTLSLEATNYCNLSCSHCKRSFVTEFSKGNFDLRFLDKVKHLMGTAIPSVSLSDYGEPFLSGVWDELLAWALSLERVHISFTTNGLLLNRHLEDIIDPRISMAVSVDGATEETYGYFRGKGNFRKLIDNLMLLKRIKEDRGISYPDVSMFITVSRVNCHELSRMVELAKEVGARTVVMQFQIFFDPRRFSAESVYFSKKDYDRAVAEARRRASELGICLIHPDSFDGESAIPRENMPNMWLGKQADGSVFCFAQRVTSYIKYNGLVEACCSPGHLVRGDLSLDTFEDIWHGPLYRELRLAFDRGVWPPQCAQCNLIQSIDSNDEGAHFISLKDVLSEGVSVRQRYRVTEIESIYQAALASLPDHRRALDTLAPVMALDDNLYEIENLVACLLGLTGDMKMMREHLTKCREIAPRDGIIERNHAAIAKVERGGFFAFFRR